MKWFRRQDPRPVEVADQREYERIRMILGVVCRQRGEDFNIFTDDVSAKGMRFVSQHPVHVGEEVTLFVVLQDQQPVTLKGHVAWLKAEGEQQFTGGISFRDVAPDVEERWVSFIERNRSAAQNEPELGAVPEKPSPEKPFHQ